MSLPPWNMPSLCLWFSNFKSALISRLLNQFCGSPPALKKKNEMEYSRLQLNRKGEKILDWVTHRKGKHCSVKVVFTVVPLTSHLTSLVSVTHGNRGPKILNSPTHQHCHGVVIQDHSKQTILPLTDCEEVNSSLTLCHHACVTRLTSSHHVGMVPSHEKKGECSTVRYFEKDIDHSH